MSRRIEEELAQGVRAGKPDRAAWGLTHGRSDERRYVMVRHLVAGGMADVYLARDTLLDRKVVIKTIRTDLQPSGPGRARLASMFLNEARTVARVTHPNIVRVYDFGFEVGLPYMAMEWLEGWDLQKLFSSVLDTDHQLEFATVLNLISHACHGLHAVHGACDDDGNPLGIVHRDLSPHNLFLTVRGEVKLIDFGIANTALQRSAGTGGDKIRGKYAYMSPEQVNGQLCDARSDVFTLGIVLYELLTGAPLFSGLAPSFCFEAVSSRAIARPARAGLPLPDRLVGITMRALQRNPDQRYQTAAAMAEDIENAARQLQLVLTQAEMGRAVRRIFEVLPAEAFGGGLSTVLPESSCNGRNLHVDDLGAASAEFRAELEALERGETQQLVIPSHELRAAVANADRLWEPESDDVASDQGAGEGGSISG